MKKEMGGAGSTGVAFSTYGGRGEVHTGFWWGNLRERDHLDGRILLQFGYIFKK